MQGKKQATNKETYAVGGRARSNWKLHVRRNGKKGKTRTDGRVRDLGTFKLQTACLTEAWPRGYGGRVDVGAVKKE